MKFVHKDGNKEGNKITKFDYFQRLKQRTRVLIRIRESEDRT